MELSFLLPFSPRPPNAYLSPVFPQPCWRIAQLTKEGEGEGEWRAWQASMGLQLHLGRSGVAEPAVQ